MTDIKGIQKEKGLCLQIICSIKDSKDSTRKNSILDKYTQWHIRKNAQKLVAYLYWNDKHTKKEIKKIITFKIVIKKS